MVSGLQARGPWKPAVRLPGHDMTKPDADLLTTIVAATLESSRGGGRGNARPFDPPCGSPYRSPCRHIPAARNDRLCKRHRRV